MILLRFAFVLIIIFSYSNILGQGTSPSTQRAIAKGNLELSAHLCGTSIMQDRLFKIAPAAKNKHAAIDQQVYLLSDKKFNKNNSNAPSKKPLSTYTIPVVVHIIHQNGTENISDATVIQGIQDLNDAYENIGAYDPSTGVDVDIEFCLAMQDENGIFTTGINRVQNTLTDLIMETQDTSMKNLIRWDPTKYLNIWLVKEITSTSMGSGVAGYAYFPSSHGNPEDGIVVEARWFGSNTDDSKIHVHEVGHYLGLYHTFEGGCTNNDCLADGDKICDTPPDASTAPVNCGNSINTCTTDEDDTSVNNPFRPVVNGGLGEQDDLTIDYMDYGYQTCQSAFTAGQKDRMIFMLTGARNSLLQSNGCQDPCTNPITAFFNVSATTVNAGTTVTFTNTTTGATTYEWQINSTSFSTSQDTSYTFNTQGAYTITLIASNGDPSCTQAFSITIQVNCPVSASFTSSNTNINPGDSITFTNTSTGAISYEWFLDGTSVGTAINLTYTFNSIGGFMVYLVAYNGTCYDTSEFVFIQVGNCTGKEANVWYFGYNAGIDFNSGSPVALTNGASNSYEGTASISHETTGQLLFYTDGDSVFDNTHNKMPNGGGLYGDAWYSTQTALIVPWPGDTSKYFIFTAAPYWWDTLPAGGIHYSVVDMTLNSGLGDVTTKNQPLLFPATEKLTGVKHCNGEDYWVITHEWNTNNFYAWLVTNAGITDTVISSVGKIHTGDDWLAMGSLKASPDGKKLAIAVMDFDTTYFVELFDFNSSTGIVSNPIGLPVGPCPFGVSFSPNSSKLYISGYEWCWPEYLYQFDISSGDSLTITASRTILDSLNIWFGTMQTAPDGKIYISIDGELFLGVINNPNAPGISCNYVFNGFNLGGQVSSHGLPNFIESYFDDGKPEITGPDSVCSFYSNITYTTPTVSCSVDTVEWTVIGNATINSFTDTSATIDFSGPGVDTLIVKNTSSCSVRIDTLLISVTPMPVVNLGNDTALCTGSTMILDAGPGFTIYEWQDSSANQTDTATSAGTYWVEVTDSAGCTAVDTVIILAINPPPPIVDLGNDTTVCEGNIVWLNAGSGYTGYLWQDNSVNQTFTAWLPGTYWVTVTNACGITASDTIDINLQVIQLVNLGADTSICDSTVITFDAGGGFISYIWQDGSAVQFYTASSQGTYWVAVADSNGCAAADTILIFAFNPTPPVNLGNDTTVCQGTTVTLNAGSGTSYQWQDNSANQTLTALLPGTYWVEVTDSNGCTAADTIIILNVNPPPPVVALGDDTTVCEGDIIPLDAGSGNTSYLWQDNSTNQTFTALIPGTYWVKVANACGITATDTIAILLHTNTLVNLGADTTLCEVAVITLDAGSGFASYTWQDGSSAQTYAATSQGTYWVTVVDTNGCLDRDTITITSEGCENIVFVPDIFSPNDDNRNDIFYIQGKGIESLNLVIYDRWGEKVFEKNGFSANDPRMGWDGSYRGEMMNSAVFVYVLTGQFITGESILQKGDFTLIR